MLWCTAWVRASEARMERGQAQKELQQRRWWHGRCNPPASRLPMWPQDLVGTPGLVHWSLPPCCWLPARAHSQQRAPQCTAPIVCVLLCGCARWSPGPWRVGMLVDAQDRYGHWYEATVEEVGEKTFGSCGRAAHPSISPAHVAACVLQVCASV